MVLICFGIALIIKITFFLLGFNFENLISNRIYIQWKKLIRLVDLIAIISVSYLMTSDMIDFIILIISLVILYIVAFAMRIERWAWYISIVLVIAPTIALIAIKNVNLIIIKHNAEVLFGTLLLATSQDFLEEKSYTKRHYVSIVIGISVAICFVISGIIPL